jgi:hypothetical protein
MVNSVLSTIPTFYIGEIKFPMTVVKQIIDKYIKHGELLILMQETLL